MTRNTKTKGADMANLNIPANTTRVLEARGMRLNQSMGDMLRYQGWESVEQQELEDARNRHKDRYLGDEELISAIEVDGIAAKDARASEARAV